MGGPDGDEMFSCATTSIQSSVKAGILFSQLIKTKLGLTIMSKYTFHIPDPSIHTYFSWTSLFAARLFWTFHNKLHNMKALVILSHHTYLFLWTKMNFCGSQWAVLVYFRKKKLPTVHCFNTGAHIGICAQISRNTLLYLSSLKTESPILLLMLISAW